MRLFRPKKAMRKQWRRLKKSMRGATSPRPFSPSTSSGRTTGYGKISGTEKMLLSQRALCLTHQESQQSTKPLWILSLIPSYIYCATIETTVFEEYNEQTQFLYNMYIFLSINLPMSPFSLQA